MNLIAIESSKKINQLSWKSINNTQYCQKKFTKFVICFESNDYI